MTTTTTGVFFVSKDRPGRPAISEHKSDAGEFILKKIGRASCRERV